MAQDTEVGESTFLLSLSSSCFNTVSQINLIGQQSRLLAARPLRREKFGMVAAV